MKWLDIRGLVICIIVFILLNTFFGNINNFRITDMVDKLAIGERYWIDNVLGIPLLEPHKEGTFIHIKGNAVIAFLTSALIYLVFFIKKKK